MLNIDDPELELKPDDHGARLFAQPVGRMLEPTTARLKDGDEQFA